MGFEKQNMSKKNTTKKSALILFSGCKMIHFEGRENVGQNVGYKQKHHNSSGDNEPLSL